MKNFTCSLTSQKNLIFWFSSSLTVAGIFGFLGLPQAFSSEYIVQDDARQHIFWMERFRDQDLFSNDIIADYFQSVSPWGYSNLYRLFAELGIDPFLFNKILPIILAIITGAYCFKVCTKILPVPLAGFLATLLLSQHLWLRDDLYSGTPRSFIYPLLLAFLYYLLEDSLLPCLLTIVLQGLFYPQTVLISAAILLLRILRRQSLEDRRESKREETGESREREVEKTRSSISHGLLIYFRHFIQRNLLNLTALIIALLILISYALKISQFGSVISADEARNLPEFLPLGRSKFFLDNPIIFWLCADRSGIFPGEWQYILAFSFGGLLLILPKKPNWFPMVRKINSHVIILPQIILASLTIFFLAHLFLFKLHLPGRYTQHSLRIVMALAGGIAIAILLDAVFDWINKRIKLSLIIKILIGVLLIVPLLYPSYAVMSYPERLAYVKGEAPSLYQFLSGQPKDSLIASLTREADFIPTFAHRSVLVSEEYSIPYHTGYYKQIKQRTIDLINAQYSENLEIIKEFIEKYKIDFWLIEKQSFKPSYIQNNPWLMQFQTTAKNAMEILEEEKETALAQQMNQCIIFEEKELILLEAQCLY